MRTKKALYNIVAQMNYVIVAMVCGLILPRFILAAFGSSYNGMISSITQFLDYISILTLGISGSTRVAIYKANASGGIREVSAVLKATERYMRKVAIAFVAYMLALTIIYPYIVRNEFSWAESASLVVIIGIGTFAEYFFGITYKTFLMANQSMYIYNVIQIFSKIANTIVSILLIKAGQSLQIVKLGSTICFAATPIALNYIVKKKYNIISNIEPDKSALKQRGDAMAHSIANCIHQYTDVFLLTLFTSPQLVSVYSVYTLILGSLKKLQNVFTSGLEGAYGDLWAKGEIKKFEENFNTFEYLIFSFVSVVFSCAAVLILPFIKIYTKGVNDTEYILPVFAGLSIIAYAVFCLRAPYLTAVQAAGKYKETRNGAFVEAGLNFTISFISVFKFGLIGVTLGTLAANVFRTIQYAVFISQKMLPHRSIWEFIKRCVWLLANVVIIYVVLQIIPHGSILSWSKWITTGICDFVIAMTVTGIMSIVFYRKDLFRSFKVVKRMMKK